MKRTIGGQTGDGKTSVELLVSGSTRVQLNFQVPENSVRNKRAEEVEDRGYSE